jgi:hypothetical protein
LFSGRESEVTGLALAEAITRVTDLPAAALYRGNTDFFNVDLKRNGNIG